MPNCLKTFNFATAVTYDSESIKFYYNGALMFTLQGSYTTITDMILALSGEINALNGFTATPSSNTIDVDYDGCDDCQNHTYRITRTGSNQALTSIFSATQLRAVDHYDDFFYWVSFNSHELYTSDDTALDKTVDLSADGGEQPVDLEIVNNGGSREVWIPCIDLFAGPKIALMRYSTADPPVHISNHTYGASGIVQELKYDAVNDYVYALTNVNNLLQLDSSSAVAVNTLAVSGTVQSLAVSSVTGDIAVSNTAGEVYITDDTMSSMTLAWSDPGGDPVSVYDIDGDLYAVTANHIIKLGSYDVKGSSSRFFSFISSVAQYSSALFKCDGNIIEGSTTTGNKLNIYSTNGILLESYSNRVDDAICVDDQIFLGDTADALKLENTVVETINYTENVITDCDPACGDCDRIKTPIDHSKDYSCDTCGDCQGNYYPISKNNELPSFQFWKEYSNNAITSWSVQDICNATSTPLTAGDLEVCNGGKCDVVSYMQTAVPTLACSVYKSVIIADGETFESCPFRVVDDVSNMLKLEWWDDHNIGGRFYTGGYKNIVYLDESLIYEEPTFEDSGSEDGKKDFVSQFRKRKFPYRIHTIKNSAFARVLFDIQLHKYFKITEPSGKVHEPENVEISLEYVNDNERGQCIAEVNITWEDCEDVTVKGCENEIPVGDCISDVEIASDYIISPTLADAVPVNGTKAIIKVDGDVGYYEYERSSWNRISTKNYQYVGLNGTNDYWLFIEGIGEKMGELVITKIENPGAPNHNELIIKGYTPLGSWNTIEVDVGAGFVTLFSNVNYIDLLEGVETTTLSGTSTCSTITFRVTSDIKSGSCTYVYTQDYYFIQSTLPTLFADSLLYCNQQTSLIPGGTQGVYTVLVIDTGACSFDLEPYKGKLWEYDGVNLTDITPVACTIVETADGDLFVYDGTQWIDITGKEKKRKWKYEIATVN